VNGRGEIALCCASFCNHASTELINLINNDCWFAAGAWDSAEVEIAQAEIALDRSGAIFRMQDKDMPLKKTETVVVD
jgi:hypothetical protein